jgi:hypothetical protein
MNVVDLQVRSRRRDSCDVALLLDGKPVFTDSVCIQSSSARARFAKRAVDAYPGLAGHEKGISDRLLEFSLDPPQTPERVTSARESQADALLRLAEDWECVHDSSSKAYAILRSDGVRQVWPLDSGGFQQLLAGAYFRSEGRAASEQALRSATSTLMAKAVHAGRRVDVFVRVAKVDDVAWIDLCDSSWRAIRIDAQGYQVVEEPGVLFVRMPGMQQLPEPVAGGDLTAFFARFNFGAEDNQRLVSAVLVNWAMLTSTYPVLVLVAEQGSGKTTATRALRKLIDPNVMDVRTPPKSSQDIFIASTHGHVLAFENLSGMRDDLADDLCRISTGAAFATRKLYSDAAEQQFRVARPVILNGIDEMTGRSDLADRSVVLQLQPVESHARRTEVETWSDFDMHHPSWLGWVCSAVQGVLASKEPIGTVRERMADFSVIGSKLEQWCGWPAGSFSAAYRENRERAILMALESSAIGVVLQRVVELHPKRMSVGDLLAVLDSKSTVLERRHPGWPRSPKALMNAIRRLNPALRLAGIEVEVLGRGGTDGAYQLALRRVK